MQTLRPVSSLHFDADLVRPLVLRSSARLSAGAFSGRGRGPRRRRLRSFLFSRAPNGRVQSKLSAQGAARLSQPAAAAQPALELHPRRP